MTQRQITTAVKNHIKTTYGYTPYTGQIRSIGATVIIDNRQDFAPFQTAQEICEKATGLRFAALGTHGAHPLQNVK